MFVEQQTGILEWIPGTLKTAAMAADKFSFAITGINSISKYIKIENSYCKL